MSAINPDPEFLEQIRKLREQAREGKLTFDYPKKHYSEMSPEQKAKIIANAIKWAKLNRAHVNDISRKWHAKNYANNLKNDPVGWRAKVAKKRRKYYAKQRAVSTIFDKRQGFDGI